jgi:hypothetical protein
MAQVVKHLPSKPKALSLISSTTKEKENYLCRSFAHFKLDCLLFNFF